MQHCPDCGHAVKLKNEHKQHIGCTCSYVIKFFKCTNSECGHVFMLEEDRHHDERVIRPVADNN